MKRNLDDIFEYRIKGVLFDFDGTLTEAGLIDFTAIKKEVGCPHELPVLEYIEAIADDTRRRDAHGILERAEREAAEGARPNSGAEELLVWLHEKKLPLGILTRNTRENVVHALKNFDDIDESWFSCIISRDDAVMPKPDAGGVFLAAEKMNVVPEGLLVVGDYHFDIEAGKGAGSLTCFITNNSPREASTGDADFVIDALEELVELIELGLPLQGGKLPNHILERYLAGLHPDDPAVLVSPGVGEDVAAVKWGGEEVLLLKSDPITFISDSAGKYAVLVNANDIATSGGIPRWFLTTFLFPPGSTPSSMVSMIGEVDAACREMNILLCGGHTEVTDAVTRPVVSGMMSGTVAEGKLRKKSDMREGDLIVMTKAAAVEGTAILASEFHDELKKRDIPAEMLIKAVDLEKMISILPEARIAAKIHGVTSMHDVTEGGIATALDEFASAGGNAFHIDRDKIPVFQETNAFCTALDINPLGLIGSGTLLITVNPEQGFLLLEKLSREGIAAAVIGTVGAPGRGIHVTSGGKKVSWEVFPADELTRLF